MIFVLVAAVSCLAAIVQAALGLGFPLVAIPLLTTVLDVRSAVITLAIPGLLLNLLQVWRGRSHLAIYRQVLTLLIGLIPGGIAGAYLLTLMPVDVLTGLIGAVIIVYVMLAMLRLDPRVSAAGLGPIGAVLGVVVGFVAGLLAAATGINGPILAIYLAALGLDKNAFVAAISLTFVAGQLPRIAGYAVLGLFTRERLLLSALMFPSVVVGFAIGAAVRSRISQRTFALALRLMLLVTGVRFILHALSR